jgi:hypothetical protein
MHYDPWRRVQTAQCVLWENFTSNVPESQLGWRRDGTAKAACTPWWSIPYAGNCRHGTSYETALNQPAPGFYVK